MYKSVLLPEILECVQAFFPSLIEQSYEHCKVATSISLREVRSANSHLCNRFQRVLALPVTRPRAIAAKPNFAHLEREANTLSQLWSIAAQEEIPRNENPLAPEQLLAAIENSLQLSCLHEASILSDEIEKQLELVGENFYQKINRILAPCAKEAVRHNTPNDSTSTGYCPPEQPTLSEAEKAIEQVKRFFDNEITDEKIGTRFHALCKKMYIPAINCALMSPPGNSEPGIVQLLQKIQRVGQYWFKERINDAVLIARAENTVRRFIKAAMQGHTDLTQTLKAVEQIILEYHIDQALPTTNAEAIPAPVTTFEAKGTPPSTATDAPSARINAVPAGSDNQAINDSEFDNCAGANASDDLSDKDSAPALPQASTTEPSTNSQPPQVKAAPKPSIPTIYKQAKHLIDSLLVDCAPNSLAHQLRKEWLRVLEAAGSRQGINSKAWGHAIDIFLCLAEYSHVEDIPISLAYKAQAQLKFASIDNQFFDAKTQSLKIRTPAGAIISEGHWFDYIHNGKATRCKLAAIIRQIGRFIFVSRQGQKVLEVDKERLETLLKEGSLRALGEVSVNSTIEDVLSNIKHVQAKELT